jgi:hypothetical protein
VTESVRPLAETAIDEQSVVETVVQTVSAVDGRPPESLPPLGNAVDTDAITALVEESDTSGYIVFDYVDYRVRVDLDGVVTLFE